MIAKKESEVGFSSAKRALKSKEEVLPVANKRAEIMRNLQKSMKKRKAILSKFKENSQPQLTSVIDSVIEKEQEKESNISQFLRVISSKFLD